MSITEGNKNNEYVFVRKINLLFNLTHTSSTRTLKEFMKNIFF